MNVEVLAMVLRVECRLCRARPGERCARAGAADRPTSYRRDNPHRLRVKDATRE